MMRQWEGIETMQEINANNNAQVASPVPVSLSETEKIKKGICPSCDGDLVFQEGCKVCHVCGWGGCE
jgi:cytochrome c5